MRIVIFGVTGSIGTQALQVLNKQIKVVGISYFNNEKFANQIIQKHKITYYYSPNKNKKSNVSSYSELINKTNPDLILNAISGYQGLEISLLSINKKIDLALANKETLVMAGKFIMNLAKKNKVKIFPVDSEHSSLYDLLLNSKKEIKKLYITCSGGKYFNTSLNKLKNVKADEVIKHPNWNMGKKISIDSSTLMNKCFEIVEAYWLFNTKEVEAIYHPQSMVHSMVEFIDGSIFMNVSKPDMRLPISLAINKYQNNNIFKLDQFSFSNLNFKFDSIDEKKWKPFKWAKEIINDKNNSLAIVINVSNDIAVNYFINNEINFLDIIPFIEKNIKHFRHEKINSIKDIKKLVNKIENFNKLN